MNSNQATVNTTLPLYVVTKNTAAASYSFVGSYDIALLNSATQVTPLESSFFLFLTQIQVTSFVDINFTTITGDITLYLGTTPLRTCRISSNNIFSNLLQWHLHPSH